MNMIKLITFEKPLANYILGAFGKSIDSENNIVDKKSGEKILTQNGDYINIDEFGGIIKGSEIYLKSDIISLINFVELQK